MPLSPENLETVREITLETSLTAIEGACSSLDAAQETRLLAIIGNWDSIRFTNGDLVPNNQNEVFYAQEERRRQIRHTVRLMLGLPAISETELEIAQLNGTYGTLSAGLGGGSGKGGGGGIAESGIVGASGIGSPGELGG